MRVWHKACTDVVDAGYFGRPWTARQPPVTARPDLQAHFGSMASNPPSSRSIPASASEHPNKKARVRADDERGSCAASRALTNEQETYAGADLTPRTSEHECLIVEAYAGTGKSHSTLQFAARRQALGRRVLVLYFNKAMFTEMQVKLAEAAPGAVCSTMDALVLREFKRQAPDLVEGDGALFHDVERGLAYSAFALRRAVGIDDVHRYKGTIASHTRRVLTMFVHSSDVDIADLDDPRYYRIKKWWEARQRRGELLPPLRAYARTLWRRIISLAPADANLKLSFAEIAKCFQLLSCARDNKIMMSWMRRDQPCGTVLDRITDFGGTLDYDFVVIDEAQDLNPTHMGLFVKGPRRAGQRIAHVLVGDPFQSLYAWRGARNALRDAKAELRPHTLVKLTRSFRFGKEVAALATAVLRRCGIATTAELVGAGPPGRVHHRNDIQCHDWRCSVF